MAIFSFLDVKDSILFRHWNEGDVGVINRRKRLAPVPSVGTGNVLRAIDSRMTGTTVMDAAVIGTLVAGGFARGSVLFADGEGVISEDNKNFFWNDTNNALIIGDNSVDTNMTSGLCIKQGNVGTFIVALQATGVAQPYTTFADTETYGTFQQGETSSGGLRINSYCQGAEGDAGFMMYSYHQGADADDPCFYMSGATGAGPGASGLAATDLLLGLYDNGTIRVSVFGNGNTTFAGTVRLPVLAGIPGTAANGDMWMEADGLHIYYGGSEKVVDDT